MTCRQCRGIEQFFDQKEANGDLKGYRKKGPAKTTQMLIDAIEADGIEDKTLLDIGGGVGAIQHELLKAGARGAVSVDASTAYIEASKEESQRQGHADRLQQRHGDFVDIAPEIEPADVVTLDRVICCYHDLERLVSLSSERATRLYGLVYPRENWVTRTGFGFLNLFLWLRRSPFRIFVHPTATVDALVRRGGFQRRFYRKTLIWQVVVYSR
jgi:magnesium-protoporphyrin O-methyltransferase